MNSETRSEPPQTAADWKHVHRQGMSIATRKARIDHEEAEWMLTAEPSGVHRQLGYASFCQYLEFLFGYSRREAPERLKVAKRLAKLPAVFAALRSGTKTWSGCRELSRVATPETETEWLAATADKNMRQIETMVSGLEKGDLPRDPKKLSAATHRLSFEVDGDSFALWREAVKKLRAEHGGSLTDDEIVATMARKVLEGPTDEGRASYQIALSVCEACEQAFQLGSGEAIPVSDEVLEMACCDAQHIGQVKGGTHVGEQNEKNKRATQVIPPAIRRLVMKRDNEQCVVDGCSNATFVDVHHMSWDGTDHDIEKIAVFCSNHHKRIHAGTLIVEGTPSTGLSFTHADGTPYGSRRVEPERVSVNVEAFEAIKSMGFRAGDARRAVDRAVREQSREQDRASHVGASDALQEVMQGALRILQPC